jgi:Arc/MetJ-type ribon-helix-helix transcriptional regulator
MSAIDISLPEALQKYVQEQVAHRGFSDAGEYLRSLIEADQHRQLDSEVEAMLLQAVDGPFTDWNERDLDDIRRVGSAIIDRRKRA